MRELSHELMQQLLSAHQPPCISMYMPTARHHPGTAEGPLRFRALLEKAQRSLKAAKGNHKSLLDKLAPYIKDSHFWNHQLDGVAFFAAPGFFEVVQVQRALPELVVVADSFHLKPLLRIVQSADRFHLLCLSQKQVRLFEGNRYHLDEVELQNVPRNIVESVAWDKQDGGLAAAAEAPPEKLSVHRPKGEFVTDYEVDLDRYFRAVDLAVWQHHSEAAGLPLLLAALPDHQVRFRIISRNRHLMPEGLDFNPDFVETERLLVEAWRVFEPQYRRRIDSAVDQFRIASSQQAGSDDIQKVAEAAAYGKVHTLLVEADRHISGKLADEGKVIFGPLRSPDTDDVLDDIAERVLRTGGAVYVIPADQMPTGTGMAATYRY